MSSSCFNGRKSDKRVVKELEKENYKIELFMPCMHIDHLYGFQSWGKHFIVCGNFRMEFVKINNSELLWMKYCNIWLKLSSALSIFLSTSTWASIWLKYSTWLLSIQHYQMDWDHDCSTLAVLVSVQLEHISSSDNVANTSSGSAENFILY